jgi:hypothetical protein
MLTYAVCKQCGLHAPAQALTAGTGWEPPSHSWSLSDVWDVSPDTYLFTAHLRQ